MYSIPSPVIKTILNHCDLPTAITFARVTKRCSTIFRQYREEILIRGEYVNVRNMFNYCSDEFIITMSRHKFFDKNEAYECCRQMRYHLFEKMGYGKLCNQFISKNQLREIYEKKEYDKIFQWEHHKLEAAKLGIDLDIPYPENRQGLEAALLLRDEKMIDKLSNHGSFYVYCVTGYYHLADNYGVALPLTCINNSHDPVATFNYIEKRGYEFNICGYFSIENTEVIKKILPRIKDAKYLNRICNTNYDSLKLITNKLLEFTTIDKIFKEIKYNNPDFTKYLLCKYEHLINKLKFDNIPYNFIIKIIDFLDKDYLMQSVCDINYYTLIRALVRRNGREWASKFNHPFIKKYY